MGAAFTNRGRLRLLEVAFEQGVHHFDTAPLYGHGQAEALLGKFSHRRRDAISITTKFGLLPRQYPTLMRPLIPIGRIINRRILIPYKQRPSHKAPQGAVTWQAMPSRPVATPTAGSPTNSAAPPIPYTPSALRSQLEQSLRNLKTDHIDYYLLHECQAQYLNQPFLDCLDDLVREGKIRHYGIGSGRWQSRRILESYPSKPWAVQIPDGLSDLDTNWFAQQGRPPLFTHSSLRLSLANGTNAGQSIVHQWAKLTHQDPNRPELLGEMLLTIALIKNLNGCVIFSSRHDHHIRTNTNLLNSLMAHSAAVEQLLAELAKPAEITKLA